MTGGHVQVAKWYIKSSNSGRLLLGSFLVGYTAYLDFLDSQKAGRFASRQDLADGISGLPSCASIQVLF